MNGVSRYKFPTLHKRGLLYAVVLCIIGLGGIVGCSMDKSTAAKIDEAERIMQSNP